MVQTEPLPALEEKGKSREQQEWFYNVYKYLSGERTVVEQ
jgi:hypothetical protein